MSQTTMLWRLTFSDLWTASVGFLIKTAVCGQFRFLWFQMLIKRTANSENQRTDDYRICIVLQLILVYHTESYWLLLYRGKSILCASLQVRQLLTGCITQDHHRAFVSHHPLSANAIWSSMIGKGVGGREEEGDCNLIPVSPWHQDGTVLALGHQQQMMTHPVHQQAVVTTVSTVNVKHSTFLQNNQS